MALAVVPFARPGKGRQSAAVEAMADIRDELTAAGQEMVALGRRIEYALMADRPDVALHVAARLQVLGASYANPEQGDSDHAA